MATEPNATEEEILKVYSETGSIRETAKRTGSGRDRVTRIVGVSPPINVNLNQLIEVDYKNPYNVVIFSDCHYWPDHIPPAHKILVQVLKDLQPKVVIANGDIFDGYSISRHPKIMWNEGPTVEQELRAVQARMGEISNAAPKAKKYRTYGNHCIRFESFLATNAQQFAGVYGTALIDHLPAWEAAWGIVLNEEVMVKHRWKGGKHAAYNNTEAGMTFITGHTHRLGIRPRTNYKGTIYGIEDGCIVDPSGPQFEYTEMNPLDWQPGFIVLTVDGKEIWPQTVEIKNGKAYFGGRKYKS